MAGEEGAGRRGRVEEQGVDKMRTAVICQRKLSSEDQWYFNCNWKLSAPTFRWDGKGRVSRDQPWGSSRCAVSRCRQPCWVWRASPCQQRVVKGTYPQEDSGTFRAQRHGPISDAGTVCY